MKSEMTPAVPAIEIAETGSGLMGDLMVLTKARLTLLVLITTFVGFCLGSRDGLNWSRLFCTLVGTGLVAAAAAILNQVIETRVDRLMDRTKFRPLPAGRWKREKALALGVIGATGGLLLLALTTNMMTTVLAALTLLIYIAIYTPMKRWHPTCVAVGAVSGAIPPVIGWAAAGRSIFEPGAGILFGILFLWQMPHFLAIAWMYRDEYAQAGFYMLDAKDRDGSRTSWKALFYSIALLAVTACPFWLGWAGVVYLTIAMALNALLLWFAIRFVGLRSRPAAVRLFFASIIYLPVMLGLMLFAF